MAEFEMPKAWPCWWSLAMTDDRAHFVVTLHQDCRPMASQEESIQVVAERRIAATDNPQTNARTITAAARIILDEIAEKERIEREKLVPVSRISNLDGWGEGYRFV